MSQPTLAPPAPALAEIEEALVPALIVEKLEDGSYTVLVPSVPTPMDGAIYILPPNGCIRSTCRLPSRSRCSRNGAPAPVNSSRQCKRQSHPRPRRRRPDRPFGYLQLRGGVPRNLVWTGRRCGIQLTWRQQAFFVRRNRLAQRSSVLDLDKGPGAPSPPESSSQPRQFALTSALRVAC